MGSQKSGVNETQSETLNFDYSDIANCGPFMDSLVTLLNETSSFMQEVQRRLGIDPGCSTPVKMNDKEKQEKLDSILSTLRQKCQLEISQQESSYQTAQDITPCYCPPDFTMRSASSRPTQRSRRAGTPRPESSPVRDKVATPDQYFIPVAQSSPQSSYGRQTIRCPAYTNFDSTSKGRSVAPYSTFDTMTSQSGRGGGAGGAGASRFPSSSYEDSTCAPECAQSVNSTGRQEYRRPRGANQGAYREPNQTV